MSDNSIDHCEKGHLYLAFGKEYDTTAAYSVKALRRFSNLPVRVLSNLSAKIQHPLWDELQDVTFQRFLPSIHDREVKTRMIEYSPFEQTLFTDCDTVIHSERFLEAFELLKGCDVAFPLYTANESRDRIKTAIYQQAIQAFKIVQTNLRVLQGGVCVFRNNKPAKAFFCLWNQYWKVHQLRDMPPLVATAYNVKNVSLGIMSKDYGFPKSSIIQHFYGWKPPKTNLIPQFTKTVVNEGKGRWELRKCFR